MAPPTKTLAAPGKPSPPHQVCAVSPGSLHCVHCKKTGRFCSQIHREKSIFECTIGAWRFVDCVVFPSNEYNEGHLCYGNDYFLCEYQWLCTLQKDWSLLFPKSPRKVLFRMRVARFVGCVIFPSNEYNDGHPCLWQWLLVVLVPMSFLQMSTTHLMTLVAYNFPFSSILMFIRQVVLQPVAKW